MEEIFETSFLLFLILLLSLLKISIASDTITPAQSISDGQTLVSAGEIFEAGFFKLGSSTNRYLGVWYKKVPTATYVWVANRENPLVDSSGVIKIDDRGRLLILNGTGGVVWSSNQTKAENPVLQLLDSGNLVLREEDDGSENYLWESFDYPSDTLLTGMKLGFNLKTGRDWSLTAWKDSDDPSPGDYTFKFDSLGYPQAFLRHNSTRIMRGGPWNGVQFTGFPAMDIHFIFKYEFVFNKDETYYRCTVTNRTILSRLVVVPSGEVQRLTWIDQGGGTGYWNVIWSAPQDHCDRYGQCGAYGVCDFSASRLCRCVDGFEPKSTQDWYLRVWNDGCVRKTPLDCQREDGFIVLKRVKLPDTSRSFVDKNMSVEECREKCLKNCTCMAYSAADIREGGSGCITWSGDLVDIREYAGTGGDLYVRLAASEIGDNAKKKPVVIIVSLTIFPTIFLFGGICYCIWRRRMIKKPEQGHKVKSQELRLPDMVGSLSGAPDKSHQSNNETIDLPLFDLDTVAEATDNFSAENKLGEGGFGPVYKGKLANGQEIAVKRLSIYSGQGINEFTNEVVLIAKLQHRNLVRLLGCCIQGEEKMLIYEYMYNGSLDSILFDRSKQALLDWGKRLNIILGVARGLLYLHQDSRLRIIHRDLKASNILLDSKMNPKISDFGTARIFGGDQSEAETKRVIGTYGYMSPEYAMDGHFSEKSDVFSLGVLVLEIVSGRRNQGFFRVDDDHNLLGHAWCLWKEGNIYELTDPSMANSCAISEVMKCIQVGLLCVQKRAEERPPMSTVVLMLCGENPAMPQPKQPGFCLGRSVATNDSSSIREEYCTVNEITATSLEAR